MRPVVHIYLHSTMLLLYHSLAQALNYRENNLHSTMLLLYHLSAMATYVDCINLHSTMLLLYRENIMATKLTGYKHLHSTMLLLYHQTDAKIILSSTIYIPLCFYFISFTSRQVVNISQFTFHYASTLSQDCSEACK